MSQQWQIFIVLLSPLTVCYFVSEILDLSPPSGSIGTIIRNDLWTYDVIHVCNLGLCFYLFIYFCL